MKVRINKIKTPKERLRTTSGKDIDDLKDSIKKLGLIQPIVINEYYKLIAGDRRLRAAEELGWKEIDANIVKNLTPYGEYLIELHENWKRENFTEEEIREALLIGKEKYEEDHPETVAGSQIVKGKEHFQKKGDRIKPLETNLVTSVNESDFRGELLKNKEIYEKTHPETTVEEKYTKQERDPKGKFGGKLVTSVEKEKSQKEIKPAERFTKNIAKNLNISETQVKRHLQAAQAIKDGKVPKELEKERSYKIVKHLRKQKKKLEKPKKKEKKYIKDTPEDEEEIDDTNYCRNCQKAAVKECPYCNKMIYLCEKGLRKIDSEACKDFEQ